MLRNIIALFLVCSLSTIAFADPESAANPVNTNDSEYTFNEVLLSALEGNAEAQIELGHLYREGTGIHQDYTEALRWYREAASQGNANAENNIGV